MPGLKYFEDYQIGEEQVSENRIVSEIDCYFMTAICRATHPVHEDPEYCAKIPGIGRPIVGGTMVLALADAFMGKSVVPTEVSSMHYGYEKVRFVKPVFIGDRIHCESKVINKRIKNAENGIVTWAINIKNQNGEVVIYLQDMQYIGRKPGEKEED